MEVPKSLIHRITSSFSDGLHFATPPSSSRTNEVDLVRGLLQILQGLSSSLFYWDNIGKRYCCARSGIYVSHLSYTSLHVILDQFMFAATCLRLLEITIHKVENSVRLPAPTLSAFACSVSAWLRRLRDIALKEEEKVISSDCGTSPTLLGLANSLSSLCSGAEYLLQTVQGAIPQVYFELNSPVPAAEISCHILNHLYKKLIEICHVQDGEEDAYRMLLYLFVGSLLPYVEGLDSWLFEGTLDDPFEEMFFYINKEIAISEAEFWEKSCLLRTTHCLNLDTACTSDLLPRTKDAGGRESISLSSFAKGKEQSARDLKVCPLFVKDIAKAIISAGKSLQLIRHAPMTVSGSNHEIGQSVAGLSLSEIFCVSLMALIGYGDHISEYFLQDDGYVSLFESLGKKPREEGNGEDFLAYGCSEKVWYKFLVDALYQRKEIGLESAHKDVTELPKEKGVNRTSDEIDELALNCKGLCPINPSLTVCQRLLKENRNTWGTLNVAGKFHLPPLNDEALRAAIFGGTSGQGLEAQGTDYTMGFQFRESGHLRLQNDMKMLQVLFPFPTLLPSFQEDRHISEVLPFQKNSTLPSRVLNWIQNAEPKVTPLPMVVLQECLIVYIRKQVDYIGKHMLTKLLYDWRLMDELGVLRAIYLLGSGDLLQHFLTVIFNKLDKGEHCDDDFELNTILQESIRNSADSMLLTAPDSLVVYITKSHGSGSEEQHRTSNSISTPRKSHGQILGIDGMDSLRFTYKVSWPLELVANMEAMKKYNQVMSFLLKVKRAKFVLDKTRRWMWKDRGAATINRKHHWLVEHKLLHFVDAFHQYVMDRVYHSEWCQLCEGMAAAGSLDEAIDVHENYLLSIQRHCFVVPDKLWALIASRINSILGLALDFYSIQQTLRSGGSVSAIKARCEMEVDRIERQFDDCVAFLLRVLSFKLNVGQFPHLADLVTRINYNYFYMSDSGNLLTAPASDTIASKLGKSFLV